MVASDQGASDALPKDSNSRKKRRFEMERLARETEDDIFKLEEQLDEVRLEKSGLQSELTELRKKAAVEATGLRGQVDGLTKTNAELLKGQQELDLRNKQLENEKQEFYQENQRLMGKVAHLKSTLQSTLTMHQATMLSGLASLRNQIDEVDNEE